MSEKAIALTTFFISVFFLYQIRFIKRLRKLRKMEGSVAEKGYFLGSLLYCCWDFPECCCDSLICSVCVCTKCSEKCFGESHKRQQEKRADRKSDAAERRTTERRITEQKRKLTEIEQEKTGRKERVEALRACGFTIAEKDRNKLIEIISINPRTGLLWTSNATRLPVEEIVIIIEHEPDFEIRDEYIINKKKIQEKEDKIKIAKITCPNCENLFEPGSDFCPNCGHEL